MVERILNKTALNFLLAFLLACLLYRFYLFVGIVDTPVVRILTGLSSLCLGMLEDLALGIVFVATITLLQLSFQFIKPSLYKKLIPYGYIFLYLLLFIISFAYLANHKIFFTLFTGLSYSLFTTGLAMGFTPEKYLKYISLFDLIYLSLPLILFAYLQHRKSATLIFTGIISTTLLTFILGLATWPWNNKFYFYFLFINPIHFALNDFYKPSNNYYTTRFDKPIPEQYHHLILIDPLFTKNIPKMPVNFPHKQWNVILIVLESVSSNYIFTPRENITEPMPFLHSLQKKSLWFNNNYSAGNNSLLGVYSLLTGMYTSSIPDYFQMNKQLRIPTIATWLGKNYDSFFVMADDGNAFFQRRLVENTGFKNFYEFADIPHPSDKRNDITANELEATNFFLNRLDQAKQPFFGVYWENATHFPYQPHHQVKPLFENNKNMLNRYYNSLNLVDQQLKHIINHLTEKNLLENTIVIIVGDHGDGFGKHEDDWFHGGTVYQDQIHVPLLFYQPQLLTAQTVNQPTSSIDILPTLLDLLNVPYNHQLVQGQSFFSPDSLRKMIFVYGNENELVSITNENKKMRIYFLNGFCRVYDLQKDPLENSPHYCEHDSQEAAIIKFRNFQSQVLHKYNEYILGNCDFSKDNSCLFNKIPL